MVSGKINTELLFKEHEIRCLKRKLLMEALEKELPKCTIRYSSKVVSIQEAATLKRSILLMEQSSKPRIFSICWRWSSINLLTCDDHTVYWIMTWSPTSQGEDLEENPNQLKQFAPNVLQNLPNRLKEVIKNTPVENIVSSPLRYRRPWEMLWGNISKGNVCLVGDALHPMTPDLGQGGCPALEGGVILAGHLALALSKLGNDEWNRLEMGAAQYARERRWRSFELIAATYIIGTMQQSRG
ncbi:hypothetical protein SLEP1_g31129 [Rubroshorea leprosula]|uniref:FAD-binding domain-containing protein n=1 Tax=Rubroshorea leprosula TaxID=152421 RepID=A0AAV5KAE7_9ROSI|nr:hypothetical protein SLEP1_g31129 [Rubroshorea leprosula]